MQATLERLRQRREETGGEGGFTLIELLIVIVILGILAAVVVFAVQNLSGTSAAASCQSDFKTTETAMEAYKAQIGNYPSGSVSPSQTVGQVPGGTNAASATGPLIKGQSGLGPWLKDAPKNDHYQIYASSDGKGTVLVLDSTGNVMGTGTTATASVADCTPIAS